MPHLLPHPRSRRPRHNVFTPAAGSLALLAVALTACTSTPAGSSQPVSVTASGAAANAVRISGAGSTFDAPFFDQAFATYQQQHPGVAISYSSVGSSAGITPTDFSIVNEPGPDSYPISGYSWALLYTHQTSQATGQVLVNLLNWLTHNGQAEAATLGYVPLPARIQQLARTMLQQITGPSGTHLLT